MYHVPGFRQTVVRLAEKLAMYLFGLVSPVPLSCYGVLRRREGGNQRVSLQKCANLVIASTDWRMRDMLPSVSSQEVFMLLTMLSGEIYLRMKLHLVVKISSNVVTEHCCQVCILSMMFCCSDCRPCADMVSDCTIRKLLRVPHGLPPLRQANMGYKKYSLHLIFTFYLYRDTSVLQLFPVIVFQ